MIMVMINDNKNNTVCGSIVLEGIRTVSSFFFTKDILTINPTQKTT